MGIFEFLETYRSLGVAGLFIVMYLVTIKWFVSDLRNQRKEAREDRDKLITALEAARKSSDDSSKVFSEAKANSEAMRLQLAEFVSFLKGRDDHRGRRG